MFVLWFCGKIYLKYGNALHLSVYCPSHCIAFHVENCQTIFGKKFKSVLKKSFSHQLEVLDMKCIVMILSKKISNDQEPTQSDPISFQTDRSGQTVDQTTPEGAVSSGSTLFAIPYASFGHITLW